MTVLDELTIIFKSAWEGGPGVGRAQTALERLSNIIKQLGFNIDEAMLGKMAKGVAALGALAGGAKLAYEAFQKIREVGREGAGLDQLRLSFDTLNQTILHTPDLLNQLREGFRGTVSDTQAMSSYLTLTAGVSDELSRAFAQNAGALAEIAKAAAVLNPTLGDVNYMWESLALGIKRASFRMLDNLGLVIRQNELYKAYADAHNKSVLALTAEEKQLAVLYGVIEKGQNLIRQAGGNSDSLTDSYDRLTSAWTNLTDQVTIFFSRMVEANGIIEEVASGVATRALEMQLKNLKDQLKEFGVELENIEGIDVDLLSTTYLTTEERAAALTEQIEEETLALRALRGDTSLTAEELKYLTDVVKETNPTMQGLTRSYYDNGMGAAGVIEKHDRLAEAIRIVENRQRTLLALTPQQIAYNNALAQYGPLADAAYSFADAQTKVNTAMTQFDISEQAQALRELYLGVNISGQEQRLAVIEQMAAEAGMTVQEFLRLVREQKKAREWQEYINDAMSKMPGFARDARDAVQELAEKQAAVDAELRRQRIEALKERGSLIAQYLDEEDEVGGLFTIDVAFLGERTVSTITGEQYDNLERLRGMYERIEQQIWDYENGLTGVGDSEERRAEKLGDLYTQLANIETVMGPLIEAQNTFTTVTNTATWDMDAMRESLFNLSILAGPTDDALLGLAESTSFLSTETAIAAIKSAAMEEKIGELAREVAEKGLPWEEAITRLQRFSEALDKKYELVLENRGLDTAEERLDAIKRKLDNLDGMRTSSVHDHTIKIHVDKSELKGGMTDKEWIEFLESQGVGLHAGGWVPGPHTPVDMVPAMLTGGERVLSRDEVSRMGGPAAVDNAAMGQGTGAGPNITINVTSPIMSSPRAIANEVARRLVVGG